MPINASAAYPSSQKVFAVHQDSVEVIYAANVNDAQTEIIAIQSTLGLNPHIASAYSGTFNSTAGQNFGTVNARLNNIELGVVGDVHTQYVHKVGNDTITASSTGVTPLTVTALAGATADIFQWKLGTTVVTRIDAAGNIIAPSITSGGFTNTGASTAVFFSATGLPGSTAGARFVGGTISGPPTTGTYAVRDYVIDGAGKVFSCTAAGTPGTWVSGSGGNGAPANYLPTPVGTGNIGIDTGHYALGDHSHAGGSRAFSMSLMGG